MGRAVTREVAKAAPKRKLLYVDLGEHKGRLEEFCAARDMKVSQYVRSMLIDALADQPMAKAGSGRKAPAKRAASNEPAGRLEYVVTASQKKALEERAERAGFASVRGYVSALVRAHLTGAPQLGSFELQALVGSNGQLASLVQQLRDRPGVPADLVDQVRAHLKDVRALIQDNTNRWGA